MRYTTIASGSSGNAIYVEHKESRILVDAGLSGKKIEKGLQEAGVDPSSIDAIVVTHEHIDHVRGVGVLARRYGYPVYATEGTWQGMSSKIGEVKEEQIYTIQVDDKVTIKDLEVETFPTPHDARQSIGLTFDDGNSRLGIATDIGYVTQAMGRKLLGCEALIFESNHDRQMLLQGPYPERLKRRVDSKEGHLSNEEAGRVLTKLCDGGTQQIMLAHLSAENNRPEIAVDTVKEVLQQEGYSVKAWKKHEEQGCLFTEKENKKAADLRLTVAPRYEIHPMEEI
ncbi:MBL fold metallo-hydrolase [Heliorestis convoluta]|uniref:MBL fold metallo-hydrolase n=1 Tax=Heliorestis convoluta TaxID=356322 RepID=A0A5Q2N1Q7_9FIRM|nr:MBL fold metallo-hydrolase [Heliorestis convoluta]QGG48938.1 MBL fold metallo-hydrolase [Heliorestis convoluta]